MVMLHDVATSERDMADLSLHELEAQVAVWAAHISAGTCRWLELVGELNARGPWTEDGCGSCAEWLAWRCGLTPRSAREHVRVARRIRELPLIHAAFASGELSYAKVRALTRVATVESEQELLELARHATAAQLEQIVRGYQRVTSTEMNELEDAQYLGTYWDEDGSLVVHARLAPEEGALLLRALEAMRDRLWHRPDETCRGSAEPRRQPSAAEALAAIAQLVLTEGVGAEPRSTPYQVVVHVDEAVLEGGEGACVLDDGPAIAPETAQRIVCDASVRRAREREGVILDHGRRKRTVPPTLRRALRLRDRGCRYPGCTNRLFTDAHHVQHWTDGGETKLENLLLLCRRHHRLLHEGGHSVEPLPDGGFQFRDQWGNPIPSVPRPPPGTTNRLLEANADLDIDAETCASGDNDPLDFAAAVDAMLEICAT
jgi:hypothetical protein